MSNNAPLRIAIIITNPKALDVFFRKQIQYLQEQGCEVHAISSPGPELAAFQEATGIQVETVPVLRRMSPLADLVSLFRLWKVLRRIAPDVIHAHTPKSGLLGMMAGSAAGIRTRFFTFHGLRSETLHGWQRMLIDATDRVTSTLATHVLAVSPSMRDRIVERGLCPADKIRVVGHGSCCGVDGTVFDPAVRGRDDRNAFRDQYGIPRDAFVIGFVGRIAKDKGIPELCESWTALRGRYPKLWLFLCGFEDTDDPVDPAALGRLYCDPRVRTSGQLVRDMPAVYAGIDLLTLPSYREGFGVAAIEASAMCVPVVASRIDGIVDAVRDGVTGILVAPRDPLLLTEAVENLLRDRKRHNAMATAARPFVIDRFSAVEVSKGLLNAYLAALRPGQSGPGPLSARILKRSFDLSGAVVLLVVSGPLLMVAATVVRVMLGAPVLFRQERGGMNGEPFTVYKLRTMKDARDASGELLPDSERLTALGRFLRRTSLDELPQLWNVVRGDMSLVGPRPLLARYQGRYNAFESRRLEIRPGITGWTQVRGRNALSWEEKFRLDVWYVDHQCFLLDMLILFLTITRAFHSAGVEAPGQGTVAEFIGSAKTV